MIFIVIPVFNRWEFTKACLSSLFNQTYRKFKIVIVDHGSTDGSGSKIKENFPNVILISGTDEMWWTSATNVGIKYALANHADAVLTLNNDLIVHRNYLEILVRILESGKKTIVGSTTVDIRNPEKLVFIGVKWNSITSKYSLPKILKKSWTEVSNTFEILETDMLPGRGTLIPKSVFDEIGYFDEQSFPHYMADEDFSVRAKNEGYSLLISTYAVVLSHVDATGLKQKLPKNALKQFYLNLTSIKSPSKLSMRWKWAKRHGKIPVLYFAIDLSRILYSNIKNTFLSRS